MSGKIRILIVDDHALMRAGLKSLLGSQPDIVVAGEASSGEEGVAMAKELKPDIVLMDLSMPGIGGIEATRQISQAQGDITRVIIMTMHEENEYLLRMFEAGGSGFVRKTNSDVDLIRAIHVVHCGDVFLHPSSAKVLLNGYRAERSSQASDPLERLSERERDVLLLAAEGFTSVEIGERLVISPKTVDTYRARVMGKLGFQHRSELVHFAISKGLLNA